MATQLVDQWPGKKGGSYPLNIVLRRKTCYRNSKLQVYNTIIWPVATLACKLRKNRSVCSVFEHRILRRIHGSTIIASSSFSCAVARRRSCPAKVARWSESPPRLVPITCWPHCQPLLAVLPGLLALTSVVSWPCGGETPLVFPVRSGRRTSPLGVIVSVISPRLLGVWSWWQPNSKTTGPIAKARYFGDNCNRRLRFGSNNPPPPIIKKIRANG